MPLPAVGTVVELEELETAVAVAAVFAAGIAAEERFELAVVWQGPLASEQPLVGAVVEPLLEDWPVVAEAVVSPAVGQHYSSIFPGEGAAQGLRNCDMPFDLFNK